MWGGGGVIDLSFFLMLKVCKKGPLYEPKFIFYKTKNWKNIDKESQRSFELFIETFKKNVEQPLKGLGQI